MKKNIIIGLFFVGVVVFAFIFGRQSMKEEPAQFVKDEPVQNEPAKSEEKPVEAEKTGFRGTLEYVEGQVEKRMNENEEWKISERGDVYADGAEVRTSANSKAVLNFEDGSVARLDENTQVKIMSGDGNITLVMPSGSVFNRVAKNASRQYIVSADGYDVKALGTIFSVSKLKDANPEVMVLESQVEIKKDKSKLIGTLQKGEKASVLEDKADKKKIAKADLSKKFIAWSLEEEKLKAADFYVEEKDADAAGKIILSGKKTDKGVKLSWKAENLSKLEGFKLVRSKESNPVYPGDTYEYVSDPAARSYEWKITDGKKYHFRVCQYSGGKCVLYSNDIYLDTPEKEEDSEDGDYADKITLKGLKDGDKAKLSWEISGGEAPKGFKILSSKNKNPEYPQRDGDSFRYDSDPDLRSYKWDGFDSGKTYHFRVCVYKGGSCGAYSNDVELSF